MGESHELVVPPDTYRVAKAGVLRADLNAAVAICVHDDTQGTGGLLHLKYVATDQDRPLELTDSTLSSGLLLMDRFCKELRAAGARKQSWLVCLFGHTPERPDLHEPAATVLDLVKAYFNDSRRPVECRELRRPHAITVRLEAREGGIVVSPATEG